MTLAIIFHSVAENELNEAAAYYEAEANGLGVSFLHAVRSTVGQIIAYPEAAPRISGMVRRKMVAGFPYNLIYSIKPTEIRILAVMHQKRRPFYWRGRS